MKIARIEVTPLHPERWGDDLDVVNAARVSFNKVSDKFTEQDEKLINYLAKHQHTSPFNHSFLSFRIKAPIFVARQLVKHKFMPWNEVSRRYVDDEPEFFFPDVWRGRPVNVKQGSTGILEGLDEEDSVFHFNRSVEQAISSYQELLNIGAAPEQARMVLPQNMMTEWIWSGTLGAFLAMLKLRLDPHTQEESRMVAKKIAKEVKNLFPVSYSAMLGVLYEPE